MPVLEEKEQAQVTYARFDEDDTVDNGARHRLNQYVWENLPLTPQQKMEFRLLYLENAGRNGNDICDSAVQS
jgi:hypothetical protein